MRRFWGVGFLSLVSSLLLIAGASSIASAGHINVVTFAGSINPASSDFFQKAIAQSESDGAELLIIELDTPGGLVSSTKDILQAMLNTSVPIVVYVSPQGGWAGSAGTFITIAAHVAAMAPGTTIGAAHPVGVGGGDKGPGGKGDGDGEKEKGRDYHMEKAENFLTSYMESIAKKRNRNVEWAAEAVRNSVAVTQDEALELGVIDLVADNRAKLLEALEGREVDMGEETPRVLQVAGAEIRPIEMTLVNRFFNVLASPDIAVMLLMAGLMGLYLEFQSPGLGVAGVAGLICLILGAISLQILPFQWLGLFLLFTGIACFIAEVYITSYGALSLAGVVCLLAGGSMVFEVPEASDLTVSFWEVLVPLVGTLSLFALLVVTAVGGTFAKAQVSGVDEMLGMKGKVVKALSPEGTVFLHGEYWTAQADEEIAEGDEIEVTEVEGLKLHVRRPQSED